MPFPSQAVTQTADDHFEELLACVCNEGSASVVMALCLFPLLGQDLDGGVFSLLPHLSPPLHVSRAMRWSSKKMVESFRRPHCSRPHPVVGPFPPLSTGRRTYHINYFRHHRLIPERHGRGPSSEAVDKSKI